MNSKERLFAITTAPYEKNESLITGGGVLSILPSTQVNN